MRYLALFLLILICMPVLGSDDEFFLKERDDTAVINAFKKARDNRGVFLDALEDRDSVNSKYGYYGAYLKFEEGDAVEYLWLGDVQKYKDFYIGVIISKPRLLSNIKSGKTIGFHSMDIYDWQLSEKKSDRVLGSFLICATSEKEYLKDNGFICKL